MRCRYIFCILLCSFSRKLENEIETLEEKIDDVSKTHKQELRKYYTLLPTKHLNTPSINNICQTHVYKFGILLRIREVPGSNFGPESSYSD